MKELESRRAVIEDAIAGFRERVESVLKSVSDAGQAMQSTAVGLLGSSEQASQRAESAVKASSEASANVATAATAATELSASIAEIGHQLTPRDRSGARFGERGRNHQRTDRGTRRQPRRRSATW